MNPVARALWYIESHLDESITLDDIASACCVSRYHLLRSFGLVTGTAVIGYLRARRLSEAARKLAAGASDILSVALDAGYNSHEAFTRAFREQFGQTPEATRAQRSLENLKLTEPISMDQSQLSSLEPPRYETGRAMHLAGISERCTTETSAQIPAMWGRFVPHLGSIPGQVGRVAYGVLIHSEADNSTDYLCAVEVTDFRGIPAEWTMLSLPERRYAVFTHRDHISAIRRTWYTIWNQWKPEPDNEPTGGPEFERYGEEFNGETGLGGVEIWIPVR